MTNVKDNDMDLGLALSINNQCVQSLWNNSSNTDTDPGPGPGPRPGAGANANSRSRTNTMMFAESSPLTELVWSPQNGLSIKCADKKPCLLVDVGPSKMEFSLSCSDTSVDTKEGKRVGEGDSVGSREKHHAESEVAKGSSLAKSPRSSALGPFLGSSLGHTDKMEHYNKGKEKEYLSSSKSIPIASLAEASEGPQNRRPADLLPLFVIEPQRMDPLSEGGITLCGGKTENISRGSDSLGFNIGSPLKIQAVTQWTPQERVEMGEDKSKEDGCSSAPYLEATAENDDISKNEVKDERGDLIPREKSLYCREGDERDEDGSHGSMESCNSANLLSRRNRTWSFDQMLILGSKRIKKQTQGCPLLTPMVKQDSSFMNWISNMVKGLKPDQEEGHSLALTVHENYDQKVSRKLGFQTVFQSLYAPDAKGQETRTLIENKSVGGSNELVLADETCAAHRTGVSDHSPDEAKDGLSSFGSSHPVKTSDDLGSLWITRLFPKTPSTLLSSNHSHSKTFVAKDLSVDNASGSSGSKKVGENIQEVPKEMFDTIRRLRLSRTDVLKWTNSHFSIANLDGFFLRLRLAKWEEGLGGAGYYVAYITGSQGEKPSEGSQKPIRVNIGGVECLVESRYVSNCDFLEDELIAWWRKITTSGRIPMEGDLNSKLEERKKLGL